jgi:hypothetical protein
VIGFSLGSCFFGYFEKYGHTYDHETEIAQSVDGLSKNACTDALAPSRDFADQAKRFLSWLPTNVAENGVDDEKPDAESQSDVKR